MKIIKPFYFTAIIVLFLTSGSVKHSITKSESDAEIFSYYKNIPVSYLDVKMQEGFWKFRQDSLMNSIKCFTAQSDKKNGGYEKYLENPNNYKAENLDFPHFEPVRLMEGLSAVYILKPDPQLKDFMNIWAEYFRSLQQEDGYWADRRFKKMAEDPTLRWNNNWASHESYQMGHFIESAISLMEAVGDSLTFSSAIRIADRIAEDMLDRGVDFTPGHQEIEQALMQLYRKTKNLRYLELTKYFIAQRGHHENREPYNSGQGRYSQDHVPIEHQHTIEGHAVRAAYYYNGVTEYIGATGNEEYKRSVLNIWDDFVNKKMYIHGGGGCISAHNEGYLQKPYEINPDDAYAESCSVYGNIRWANNLFRLTGDASYLDDAERMMYNAFYASLSLNGHTFFYCNSMQTNELLERGEWHTCPCCPANITKHFARIGGDFYSYDNAGIYVKNYGASTAEIPFGEGVKIVQQTNYPWGGKIKLKVLTVSKKQKFALRLRLPKWADHYELSVNGVSVSLSPEKGWLNIERSWKNDDVIEMELKMPVKRVYMPEFPIYEGLVAFQRGPIIYCLESHDPESDLSTLYVPKENEFKAVYKEDLMNGVTILEGFFNQLLPGTVDKLVPVRLIPYGVWANQGPVKMRTWFSEKRSLNSKQEHIKEKELLPSELIDPLKIYIEKVIK